MPTDESARTYAIWVAYDGSRYVGWQVQPNGVAIQQVLTESIAQIVGHPILLHGSGRTDAGVHAEGQVAAFTTGVWRHDPVKLLRAINQRLPRDIAVLECRRVVDGFDPIRNAISKTYRYTIRNSSVPDPLRNSHHWWVPRPLNIQAMQLGARKLIGTLDFKSFETLGSARKTSVRTVYRLDVIQADALAGREVVIEIQANGFLYNMVRNITGSLVDIGRGRFGPDWLDGLVLGKERDPESQTAPARGLCLMSVQYPDSVFADTR